MMNDYLIGAFRGRKLIQRHGTVGGAIAEYTLPVIREEDKDADHSGC